MQDGAAQDILTHLEAHDIDYQAFSHKPVFTVEEAEKVSADIEGIDAKTLVVYTEKSSRFFLVSLEGKKKLEQSRVKELVGERIRFASPEDLMRMLKTTPGSVSPLGLIFDTQQEIEGYLVDQDIYDAEYVLWHPNDNAQTLQFTQEAFQQFLDTVPHSVMRY